MGCSHCGSVCTLVCGAVQLGQHVVIAEVRAAAVRTLRRSSGQSLVRTESGSVLSRQEVNLTQITGRYL